MPKQSADVTAGTQADASDLNDVRADALRMWASAGSELTISTGSVSLPSTGEGYFTVDTEADAANDDLSTISGGEDGEIIALAEAISSRYVKVVHGTGNIELVGGEDIVLGPDPIILRYDGTNWRQIGDSRIAPIGYNLGNGQTVILDGEVGEIPYFPRFIPMGWWIRSKESGSITVDVMHDTFGTTPSVAEFSASLTTAQTNSASLTPTEYAAGTWRFEVNGDATTVTQVAVIVLGVVP